MGFLTYKKQRILFFASRDLKPPAIAKELRKEDLNCSRIGIYKFLKKYEATGSIGRRVGSGRPSKITAEIKRTVEDQMRTDDETTAYQLHHLLTQKGYTRSPFARSFDVEYHWDGHFTAAPIANSSEKRTKRSDWHGPSSTSGILSRMSSGLTNVRSR